LKRKLFGSSGVRGLVNVDLTPVLVSQIGQAVATLSRAEKMLVACDTRVSGPMLCDALVSGILSAGTDTLSLGVVPTPVLAFLTKELKADAGIMVTASHNPPQYNGIKIFSKTSMPFDEKGQQKIEEVIEKRKFRFADWQNIGQVISVYEARRYIDAVMRKGKLEKRWRVVVDPGCGATSDLAPKILKRAGCEVTAVNAQPDGFFPARSPEPNRQSLEPLTNIVRQLGADVGIAYDGDGDRVAFVDERGEFVSFDRSLAAYASFVVRREQGGVVVTNVEASMSIDKAVEKYGGRVFRTKVGDVFVSEAMKKQDAIFGGEPCGAWIHPQFHYCPDGILSSILLLKAMEDENKSLFEFIAETPEYPTLRKNIACEDEAKHQVVKRVSERLKATFPAYRDFSAVDGIRMNVENGWILIRASGTEPLIRLTVEGESLKTARDILKKGIDLVKELAEEQ
jgi:phosphoglucosamine mutase